MDTFHFQSSGSIISKANQRSAIRRQPLPWRMLSADIILHAVYVLFASMPILLRVIWYLDSDRSRTFFPLTGALLKLVQAIYHASVPVCYMLFPPTVPEREELLVKGHDGLRRPRIKVEHNLRPDNSLKWYDVLDIAIICFCDWR